ncbi:MAG: hypothetical protein P8Z49_11720 [Acidobacteriota bacterium]
MKPGPVMLAGLAAFFFAAVPARGQSIPEPHYQCSDIMRMNNLSPSEYYCPCEQDCVPERRPNAPAAPWTGHKIHHGTSSQAFANQMAGMIMGEILNYIFAPPKKVDQAALAAQKAKEEAAKRAYLIKMNQLRNPGEAAQARAAQERLEAHTQNESEGQDLLGQMQDMGGTASSTQELKVQPVQGAFGTMQLKPVGGGGTKFQSMSGAAYDTSGLSSWQRALCAAYLSQSALSVVRTDPEQARYFNEQAARASAGEPISVACHFPKLPDSQALSGPNPKMSKVIQMLGLARTRAQDLEGIEIKLQKVAHEKSNAASKRQEAEQKLAQAQTEKAQAKPGDAALMAEIQQKINEAQCQLDDATRKLDALNQQAEGLLQQKENIRQELQGAQEQLQQGQGGSAP